MTTTSHTAEHTAGVISLAQLSTALSWNCPEHGDGILADGDISMLWLFLNHVHTVPIYSILLPMSVEVLFVCAMMIASASLSASKPHEADRTSSRAPTAAHNGAKSVLVVPAGQSLKACWRRGPVKQMRTWRTLRSES